uniref:Nicastrin n=1 Tax=Nothobranchius furzeri TaxID=105023 RepID=A0A8C6PQA5_NOTFU
MYGMPMTIFLFVCLFVTGVSCNSVGDKIYVDFKDNIPCVRLLNATHQIGCQSSLSGDVGVLHLLESEENLDWVLSSGPDPPYMVMLESTLFTRSVMMKLKSSSNRVAGVVVVAPNTNPSAGFSPHASCPNENSGVYTEKYSPSLAHCNATVWNPLGNNLSYEEFDFPIFSLKDDNDTQAMRQCYMDHNRPVNGSKPRYPLCAMQLFSHMSAVTDTATCMRRNSIAMSLNPEFVCDPLGDVNIWALSKPLNVTEKGHKPGESVIIAAARLDSRSFFFDIAPGAESTASGLVTLLAVAHALRNATQEAQLNTTIMYTFFHGETFDYIGSSRMVFDMERNQSIIDLDNVHSVLEVGQVGLHGDTKLWLHSDPVSRRNSSIDEEVCVFFLLNFSVEEPGSSQALPPSSFQRFLRARPIPGVVIENHQSTFTNRYYQSMYDNSDYLNVSYPPGLTPEEQLDFVTDAAKVLLLTCCLQLCSPDRPLPGHLHQLLRQDPKAFPDQIGDVTSPTCPGSTRGPPADRTCPKHLPRQASGRHPDQMPKPPQLAPFDPEEQRFYSESLPNVRAPYPISKAEPGHPTEETHFGRLYPRSRSFGHYLKLMTIGEDWDVDRPVNREPGFLAQLPLHHDRSAQCSHHCRC